MSLNRFNEAKKDKISHSLLHIPAVVLATSCHISHVGSLLLSWLIEQQDWPSCTPSSASTQTIKQARPPMWGIALSPLHMCDRLLFFKVTNLISLIWLTFARAVLMATISCPHASVAAANSKCNSLFYVPASQIKCEVSCKEIPVCNSGTHKLFSGTVYGGS